MNPEYLYPIQERHPFHRLKVHRKVSTGYGNMQFLGYATVPAYFYRRREMALPRPTVIRNIEDTAAEIGIV